MVKIQSLGIWETVKNVPYKCLTEMMAHNMHYIRVRWYRYTHGLNTGFTLC